MKKIPFSKKGFILFSVLASILVLIAIVLPLIAWSINEYSWTTRSLKSLKALNLADAGAELAIWEIAHNNAQFTGWSGMNPKELTLSDFTDNYGEVVGDVAISVENTAPDHYLVTSSGQISAAYNLAVEKTVKVKVFPHPLFNNGIFGNTEVIVSGGASIDSYDSDEGPYSEDTAGSNGDVGTNGTLSLTGTGAVEGDIFVGPSGEVIGDIPSHVTGEDYYSGNDVELEPAPFSNYFITLPSQGNLVVSKDDWPILSGDYRYESITVDGKGTITISSNTRIYVHNDFNISGQATVYTNDNVEIYIGGNGDFAGQGIVNVSSVPNNLIIYGLSDDTNLSFTGKNDFYGSIYAPTSTIYMAGDADYFGAVVGDSVELAGSIDFHFDEALLYDGPMVGYDIAYWQED